jgi:hypothetical protein
MSDKFDNKFDREYSGYIKSLINSVQKEIVKLDNINKDSVSLIIIDKLDNLFKGFFMFDDSLTNKDLQNFIEKDKEEVDNNFEKYKKNIDSILEYE